MLCTLLAYKSYWSSCKQCFVLGTGEKAGV